MKVLIVCQAGEGVGLGHFSRCLVIAKSLQTRFDAELHWLIQGTPFERDDLKKFPHRFLPLDQDLTRQLASYTGVDLVFLDLQMQLVPAALGLAILNLRSYGSIVVAIDGLLKYRSELDLIFIPSFQFKPPKDLPDGAPIVFGWDCFLIDNQFQPGPWKPGNRVLALTGGSDATQLGRTWPTLLDNSLPIDTELHWVRGPFSSVPNFPAEPRIKMVEHVSPNGLGSLMRESNYAVTVFGISFFELLYLGIPTVVFSPYGTKDDAELTSIAAAGVAIVASDEGNAVTKLLNLLSNEYKAHEISTKARAMMEKPGTYRFFLEIEKLLFKKKNYSTKSIN
jgi:spore coat polysaccharide biosynthesis predicted glycosyltransferase SpsG